VSNRRVTSILFLVVLMLVLASMACYSGQIPGVLEITPYYTETPLPVPEQSRFEVGAIAFTPREDKAFFNLTIYPEPLDRSLVNSKAMCQPNSSAEVLYVGVGADQKNYYLVECGGAVGWVVEDRLAGPLTLQVEDLAITVGDATQKVNLLNTTTFQPVVFPLCPPGQIVNVLSIQAADRENDGSKDLYYEVECPAGNRGFLTNEFVFGPLEINVGDRALAISSDEEVASEATGYRLASEPAPLTDENAVEGECAFGSVMTAEEARLVEDQVYYRMTCGDIEGWITQEHFVGPLLFDADTNVVIFVPPIPVFEDELAALTGEQDVAATGQETETEGEAAPAVAATEEAGEGDGQRRVVQYVPPLYLTDKPGPAVPSGEGANVVGQCVTGTIAHIEEYTGLDTVYYRITCDKCIETEVVEGETVCKTTETHEGWVPQSDLQGPVQFGPGERALVKDSGATDADGNPVALIPAVPTYLIGSNTRFSGRCPLAEGVEILSIQLEKDRTRNAFSFYYKVQCQGDNATVPDGTTAEQNAFNTGNQDTVIGWMAERDLQPIEE